VEMKQHLRESDRAALVANQNFIVVIRKGTDKLPAKQQEIRALNEQAKTIARVPVIVGDHRLSVDIVAPPLDNTLRSTRYDTLDARLVFRALRSFAPAQATGGELGGGGSGVSDVALVVARGFENQRHQLGRSLERHIIHHIVEANEDLTETPDLVFTPKRISLDINQDIINAVLKVRDRGEISRATMLEELDFDQEQEAVRLVREKEVYDEHFETIVPHDSPQNRGAGQTAPNDVEGGRPPGKKDGEDDDRKEK